MNRFPLLAALLCLGVGGPLLACNQCTDEDDDGYGAGFCLADCNDHDSSIHPEAPDPKGDGIDQDCDGVDGIKPPIDAFVPSDSAPDARASDASSAVDASSALDAETRP